MSGRGTVRLLGAMVAVLLPAAVLATATVSQPSTLAVTGDERVGAAGLGHSGLPRDQPASRSVDLTVVPPSSFPPAVSRVSPTPTTTVAATTTPTTRSTTRGGTPPTLPPGLPPPGPPPAPPPTGIPNVSPASAWSIDNTGVSARMRIEPSAPVAGQMVRFHIDVSSAEPCCRVLLAFGDGPDYSFNNDRTCSTDQLLSPGALRTVASHVFAGPGAYKASLTVFTGDPCQSTLGPSGPLSGQPGPSGPLSGQPGPSGPLSGQPGPDGPGLPFLHAAQLTACVAVGPGTAAQKGCSPFPDFGPDTLISPVLDPFCQVRSDCSKTSPPRSPG